MKDRIKDIIAESIRSKQAILQDVDLLRCMELVTQQCIACFRRDGKIFFCGNGGSAADAQHLAAEFSGRFYYDRDPLFAEALHVNTSYLTAVGNDYSFAEIYSRILKAKGRKGDVLFAISTSGNSENIIRAIEQARDSGMWIVGMTGQSGGKIAGMCDVLLNVPSADTPRIQECHIMLGHIICELVEANIFPQPAKAAL